MAASAATMQSIFVRPSTRAVVVRPSMYLPGQARSVGFHVRCMAENQPESSTTPETNPIRTPAPAAFTPPPPPPKPKVSTKFSDVLAFSGPAPERINGRLAMIGFVAALGVELARGDDLLTQLGNGGVLWFVGTTVLLSLASLIPLFKGVSVESKSEGLMTSNAELWNGRLAMLGLVALVLTEYVNGAALV